ncbi:hypothetical protein AOZ07_16495 [Glutamicibacter halophytocola]|nr:hypothetical protein AOZ07_16495 [Glutamicibacter halophytocola]
MAQTYELEAAASSAEVEGPPGIAPILRRSAFLLTVAALDSYFHERAISLLGECAKKGGEDAQRVASYVGKSVSEVSSDLGSSYIRLQLSFKTLVAPKNIDKFLMALGHSAEDAWLAVAFNLSSRPDRLRRYLEIVYDRRNQIAHEADWDVARFDFRPMERAHLEDCLLAVTNLVEKFDQYLEANK